MSDQTPQENTPREYSVSELDQAVAASQITMQQRDQIFAEQIERKAAKSAQAAATQIIESTTRENALDSELQQYAGVSSELTVDGSPLRQRVASEFEYLVSRGAPRDLTTELAAVRSVMGPLERAKQFSQGRQRGADANLDSYGSRPLSARERREEDSWSRLAPNQKQFYEKHINSGLYADRAAVLAELNWKRGGPSNSRGRA
jgi:hypothetical protein